MPSLDDIKGKFSWGGSEDKYIIVARTNDKNQPVDMEDWETPERTFYESPMTKDQWEQEHYDKLRPGVTYYCVKVTSEGYTLQDPHWTLNVEEENDETAKELKRVRDDLQSLEERMSSGGSSGLDLHSVNDTDEVQARLQGAVAEKGLELAEDVDDVKEILGAVAEANQPSNPMSALLGGVDNAMEINSMTDFAMLTMMPQIQRASEKTLNILDEVEGAAGMFSGGGGLLGGGSSNGQADEEEDVVKLSRDQFQALKQRAEAGRSPDPVAGDQEPTPPATETPPDALEDEPVSDSGGSFSASDYISDDVEDEDDPDPEDVDDELDDRPEEEDESEQEEAEEPLSGDERELPAE